MIDEVDAPLICTAVQQITHDVKSFVLTPSEGGLAFEAGQYLIVTVGVEGERLSRCYSISSPPTRPDSLTITVKRVPDGPVSNWLHDNVRLGDLLEVSGPYGVFTPTKQRSQHAAPSDSIGKQLFLTAGSGITPLMSMVRELVDRQSEADAVFVHHARTPRDIVFRNELQRLASLHAGVRVVLVCGPPAYRQAARALVLAAGADAGRVHEESYVIGETEIGAPPAGAGAAGSTTS